MTEIKIPAAVIDGAKTQADVQRALRLYGVDPNRPYHATVELGNTYVTIEQADEDTIPEEAGVLDASELEEQKDENT